VNFTGRKKKLLGGCMVGWGETKKQKQWCHVVQSGAGGERGASSYTDQKNFTDPGVHGGGGHVKKKLSPAPPRGG